MPYYRRNIIVLCITVFLSSVSWNQVIPYLQVYIEGMPGGAQSSDWWVALAATSQALASMLAQPLWGKMGDNTGRKPLIIRAGICLAGVYIGMSLCQAPWQIVICRALNGALTGFIPGSYALVGTNTPEQLRPRYVANMQVASSAGLIVGPALGGILADRFGFRGSMVISGVSVLLSTLAVILLVREPNKSSVIEKTSLADDFKTAFRSKYQLPIIIAVMLAWFYGSAINPYLVKFLHGMQSDVPQWFTGVIFALPALALVLTAHMWTDMGRKHGYHRIIMIGVAGSVMSFAALSFTHNIWVFAAVYFVTGAWLAAISPSTGALTCTRIDDNFRGRAFGIQNSLGTFAALVAPIMAGYVGTRFGKQWIFVMVSAVFLVGLLVFRVLVRDWKHKNI